MSTDGRRHNDYKVRVRVVNKKDEVVVQEKTFRTDAALEKYLATADNLVEVLAFSVPQ